MVDNRAAGFYGIGGSFNFKSGDISGTTANLQDDKMGQGNEYSRQEKKDEEQTQENKMQFTDRSAQLRATLSSLQSWIPNAFLHPSSIRQYQQFRWKNFLRFLEYFKNGNLIHRYVLTIVSGTKDIAFFIFKYNDMYFMYLS